MKELIVLAVCNVYGITREELLLKCKESIYSETRHVCYYVLFQVGYRNDTENGRLLNCSRCNSIYGRNKISSLVENKDISILTHIKDIQQQLAKHDIQFKL